MKKNLLAIISLGLLASCSVKTNEEKARELIEPEVKANLYYPETYEFAKISLDSCFSDDAETQFVALKVGKLWKEYKSSASAAVEAETQMLFHSNPIWHNMGRNARADQQKQVYKSEMEKAQRKAADAKAEIMKLINKNKQLLMRRLSGGRDKSEFAGWVSVFEYRCGNSKGEKKLYSEVLLLNTDFTEIKRCFTDEDLEILNSDLFYEIKNEFEDELKDFVWNE